MSPKCSSVVVNHLVVGLEPSPASTTLQPSVVDAVRATDSAETPTSVGDLRAKRLAVLDEPVNLRDRAAPFVRPSPPPHA
jgi:hypothetical protein